MILADKIINERKKNGWSQEELAEMLSVSRQSVSKWESAQAVPDLTRIIKMAEIFSVSTDYLLKDEIEEGNVFGQSDDRDNNIKKVSLEDASKYISTVKRNTPSAIIATILFILCPAVLIEMSGVAAVFPEFFSVKAAVIIGLIVLFLCITIGVILWLAIEAKEKEFDFLKTDDFDTLYGVEGMVKEKKKEFEKTRLPLLIVSVSMFILSPVGVITAGVLEANAFVIISMVCLILVMVAAGVGMCMYNARIGGIYNNLLTETKMTSEQKKAERIIGKISGAYWCLVVVVFLILGIGFDLWKLSGVLFPVAGVLYAAVIGIIKIFVEK